LIRKRCKTPETEKEEDADQDQAHHQDVEGNACCLLSFLSTLPFLPAASSLTSLPLFHHRRSPSNDYNTNTQSYEYQYNKKNAPPPYSTDTSYIIQQQQQQAAIAAQQAMMGTGMPQHHPPPATGSNNLFIGGNLPGSSTNQEDAIDKKRREVYIGNLAIGQTTREVLTEFFNQALAHLLPDPLNIPPVVNINIDNQGRFAFVEYQTMELATQAIRMDHQVELFGRAMHIGRPKGYIEPRPGEVLPPPRPLVSVKKAGVIVTASGTVIVQPTNVILLLIPHMAGLMKDGLERQWLREDVLAEARKHVGEGGTVQRVVTAVPTDTVQDRMPGRVYIEYSSVDEAKSGLGIFNDRMLDDVKIRVVHVSEDEWKQTKSNSGEGEEGAEETAKGEQQHEQQQEPSSSGDDGTWISRHNLYLSSAGSEEGGGDGLIELPGLYTQLPITSGITGLTVLNPTLAAKAQANPSIITTLLSEINEDEVPYEEGYVKLRGFPSYIEKKDIAAFFGNCTGEGDLDAGEDIKLVYASDEVTSLGEAFVRIKGVDAKLRLALAKDKSPMQAAGGVQVEVLTCVQQDLQRRINSGVILK